MTSEERSIFIGFAAYILAAIVTFGHAAANHVYTCKPIPGWESWESCSSDQGTEQKAFVGIFAGLLWPLYWSWEAFDDQ